MAEIRDIPSLEACLGAPSPTVLMKVIDHIDPGAERWLAASPVGFVACARDGGIQVTTVGGAAGFATAPDAHTLRVPLAAFDDPAIVQVGDGFGSLFLVPGIGETLRVNGVVTELDGESLLVAVEECYIHCAKALIRSGFWQATALDSALNSAPEDAVAFLGETRFMALATLDENGRADVSPKGDPAGGLLRFVDGVAHYAERPGNRRADSYRNMIANPAMAAIALIPGSAAVVRVTGQATICSDAALRDHFVVQGKSPLLVTAIADLVAEPHTSLALTNANLWPTGDAPAGISPAKILIEHVNRNKTKGVKATLVRTSLAIPGAVEKALASDYKSNLY